MSAGVHVAEIQRVEKLTVEQRVDLLAVEEPLEIRLYYQKEGIATFTSVSVTMRTPGADEDLALGFLFAEGILQKMEQIDQVKYCIESDKPMQEGNVLKVIIKPNVRIDLSSLERNFFMTSSCGVCGKASIDALQMNACQQISIVPHLINVQTIYKLPETLLHKQKVFEHTGGLHAAAAFLPNGELVAMREDVGRHNALDKLCGLFFHKNQLPLSAMILLLSGRISYELVQKAAMAGFPVICAVGAPSSLALQTAKRLGITLIGFLRDKRFNIYSHPERIILPHEN